MKHPPYKYIYGPVSSWRIGRSLGIDPVSSARKTCTFDCVYCQAGRTEIFPESRGIFVSTEALVKEIQSLPDVELDYITFAGNGEPTLARNLGDMIRRIRDLRNEKIAVITNASLMDQEDVRRDLELADLVVAKLDAASDEVLGAINRPASGIELDGILRGLRTFRNQFRGNLSLQIMFVDMNKDRAEEIARCALLVGPDEIEINTPLRASSVKPLSAEAIAEITDIFRKICGNKIRIRSVYETKREKSQPFCKESTRRRRGYEPQ